MPFEAILNPRGITFRLPNAAAFRNPHEGVEGAIYQLESLYENKATLEQMRIELANNPEAAYTCIFVGMNDASITTELASSIVETLIVENDENITELTKTLKECLNEESCNSTTP